MEDKLTDIKFVCDELSMKITIYEAVDKKNKIVKEIAFEGIQKEINKLKGLLNND